MTPALYDRPPLDQAWHERLFGWVRPDGSLKPHAEVVKRFAAKRPEAQPARRTVKSDVPAATYDQDPARHASRLYEAYRRAT